MHGNIPRVFPIPRKEGSKAGNWVIGDSTEHVCEPKLWIDIIELGGLDQCVHGRGALATTLGAGEEPGFAAQCNAAQRALCRILLRQMRPCLIDLFTPQECGNFFAAASYDAT